jgi:hypothetical protein
MPHQVMTYHCLIFYMAPSHYGSSKSSNTPAPDLEVDDSVFMVRATHRLLSLTVTACRTKSIAAMMHTG